MSFQPEDSSAAAVAHAVPIALLAWYCAFLVVMAVSPADRQHWLLVNILPAGFVVSLAGSYRRYRLSSTSYAMVTAFLTLHTIGAHYTYAEVPAGHWAAQLLGSGRNDFDRFVHFAFGLLLTYPLLEIFARSLPGAGAVAYGFSFLTQAGLSGAWEVLESTVAQITHPEQGLAYLGSQGDSWDAQHDMAAALCGSAVCLVLAVLTRRRMGRSAAVPSPPPSGGE
jgi:putative membrane protein